MNHRELWKSSFLDTDQYIDFYFQRKAPISQVFSQYDGERLASMAFYTPYNISFFGKEQVLHYIVGVATDPEYRRQGRMRELMLEGMTEAYEAGRIMTYLSPMKEEYYRSFGFADLYHRSISEVRDFASSELSVINYSRLSEEKKLEFVEFVNQKLSSSTSDMFVKRDLDYYRIHRREMRALDGGVLAFYTKDGDLVGSVSFGAEGGKCEAYEVICHKVYARDVMNALYAYVISKVHLIEPKIVFFDTEFLPDGMVRNAERKPYIMGRVIHVKNFLEQMPKHLLLEAFDHEQGFYLDITDSTLPMNNGRYSIGEPPQAADVISCKVEDLEERVFPLIHTYINDIT